VDVRKVTDSSPSLFYLLSVFVDLLLSLGEELLCRIDEPAGGLFGGFLGRLGIVLPNRSLEEVVDANLILLLHEVANFLELVE
jgi:hypothetical protein